MSTLSPQETRPRDETAVQLERAELAWRSRYSDIKTMRRLVAGLPDGPYRRVLDGFSAWREQRPDESIRLTMGLGHDAALSHQWRARVLSVRAGLLADLGLVRESFGVRQQAHEQALLANDVVEEIACLHGFAVLYEHSDADRAHDHYLETLRRIDAALEDGEGAVVELQSIKALAVLNLLALAENHELPLPGWVPTATEVLETVRPHWPEMAASVAAVLAADALALGDLGGAQELAKDCPDPRTMRDVVISPSVSTIRGRLLAATGHLDEAVDLLEAEAKRLPPRHVPEVLQCLMLLHEDAEDPVAALKVAKRLITANRRLHNTATSTAVRALEVLYRTETAEAAARRATLQATMASQAVEDLRRETGLDDLTGLHNRRHVLTIGRAAVEAADSALAVIDLDLFKEINDTLGHSAGDTVLRCVAESLRCAAGPDDIVARVGGDEFVVVRPRGGAASLVADLAAATRTTCLLPGAPGPVVVRTSIGISDGGADWDAVFERADRAMYAAKAAGGGAVHHGFEGAITAA